MTFRGLAGNKVRQLLSDASNVTFDGLDIDANGATTANVTRVSWPRGREARARRDAVGRPRTPAVLYCAAPTSTLRFAFEAKSRLVEGFARMVSARGTGSAHGQRSRQTNVSRRATVCALRG